MKIALSFATGCCISILGILAGIHGWQMLAWILVANVIYGINLIERDLK